MSKIINTAFCFYGTLRLNDLINCIILCKVGQFPGLI